jgi:hypothetical protein
LGIKVYPGEYTPNLYLTDAKYLEMCYCAHVSPTAYLEYFDVQIVAADSEDLPWDEDDRRVMGWYAPGTCAVNENQTALAHEIGHYLMHMKYGLKHMFRHDEDSFPTKCGNSIDSKFNKSLIKDP